MPPAISALTSFCRNAPGVLATHALAPSISLRHAGWPLTARALGIADAVFKLMSKGVVAKATPESELVPYVAKKGLFVRATKDRSLAAWGW
jgi:hypothetical protein